MRRWPISSLTKLLSGAQTGADRAALDWAIFRDIPHGGWCPKGRKAEDGKIPPQCELDEAPYCASLPLIIPDFRRYGGIR